VLYSMLSIILASSSKPYMRRFSRAVSPCTEMKQVNAT
jgi:hypothetical protein